VIGEKGSYASGNWFVKEGSESDFVSRWTEFLEWSRDSEAGIGHASLIEDAADRRHFISVVQWPSRDAQEAWRGQPDWSDKFNACRELCEHFEGGGMFSLVVSIEG
jgi:heme-degrading monooxygenase HmoA